jgi:hypothetical protein
VALDGAVEEDGIGVGDRDAEHIGGFASLGTDYARIKPIGCRGLAGLTEVSFGDIVNATHEVELQMVAYCRLDIIGAEHEALADVDSDRGSGGLGDGRGG